jgi:hypothetical protein
MSQIRQTAPSKHDAVTLLRTLMRDRQLCITAHAGMERDLRTYPRRVVGGGFRYGAARAGHHWDFASALIVLAHGLLGDEYEPIERHHQVEGNPALRFRGGRFIADGR